MDFFDSVHGKHAVVATAGDGSERDSESYVEVGEDGVESEGDKAFDGILSERSRRVALRQLRDPVSDVTFQQLLLNTAIQNTMIYMEVFPVRLSCRRPQFTFSQRLAFPSLFRMCLRTES